MCRLVPDFPHLLARDKSQEEANTEVLGKQKEALGKQKRRAGQAEERARDPGGQKGGRPSSVLIM
jgi:hypothetical protein